MTFDIPLLLATTAAVATAAVLAAAIRTRRHKDHLQRLAVKYSLGILVGEVPARALEKARLYHSSRRRVRLRDVLVGQDDEGRFYLARRQIGRVRHQLLFFEVEDTAHLEGFHVFPTTPRRSRWSGARRPSDWSLCLQWEASRRHWTDERSLAMGARVLFHTAQMGDRPGACMMGVEIHNRQVFIHSHHPLRGVQLDRFTADALRLRQLLLVSLRRARQTSTRKTAVSSSARTAPQLARVR